MNDIELRALKLMRLAWSVLCGQTQTEVVVQELNRLERLSPEVFEQVVLQLERDNGRWSKASELPEIEVRRNENGLVESILFTSVHDTAEANPVKSSFSWVSDHADKGWLESFTEDILSQVRAKPDSSDEK